MRALVVHPQPEALGELTEILSSRELVVDTARSATEALNRSSGADYAVLVTNHQPPELDGIDLVERVRRYLPEVLAVVMGGASLADTPTNGAGQVFRFIARPEDRRQLAGIINEALKLVRLEREQRELVRRLRGDQEKLMRREKLLDTVVRERTREVVEAYDKLKAANRQALLGLAEAIEAKDAYTKGHCARVAAYSLELARVAGYPAEGMEALEFSAFLHDIGKIGIRDSVLLKPAALTDDEWLHMKRHPVIGYEIASKIEILRPTMSCIRNHHERWDGTGYPDGLKGEEIPLSARIVALTDAFDAMATDRPYKKALSPPECHEALRRQAGKMFDPGLVELFIENHVDDLFRTEEEQSNTTSSGG
jgi:HD-GYP domain-containing protein (c-di-GMP phosphodiesterase class II)